VTVSATIRRRAPPNAPPLAEPVAVDVEFAVGQGPFATERVTLKPDEARRVVVLSGTCTAARSARWP
ncbi:hypothetical protein, partial [Actinotalea sp.]|uniref:hypothetical protein n=1 Tax=Actinotalea sp. TaxID=1872145 RepID=UPI00356266F2